MKTYTSPDGRITLINADCMDVMAGMGEKEFSLALVDPPYNIGASEMTMGSGKNKKYEKGKKWDTSTPSKSYWGNIFKISENQIAWGGNHFTEFLPISRGWIFWDKGIDGDCSFADGELAWTSFDTVLRKAPIRYKGFLGADKDERIHITQKPVALYSWILKNYAKPNDTILDTHGGSMSIAIAVHKANTLDNMNLKLTCIELDSEYYKNAVNRFKNYINQQTINFEL